MMVDLTFIHSHYGASTDEEEKYSSKALARSHAAKAAHKKRRSKKLTTQTSCGTRRTHHFLSNYEGNSDPFNATLAVKVTPRVHQTLVWIQNEFIPSNFAGGAAASRSWIRDYTCDSYFKGQATSILNEPSFLGDILPYLTMIAMSKSQVYEQEALTIQLKVVQKAKEAFSDHSANHSDLLLFIKALLASAIIQQDIDAAKSHATIFGHFLSRQIDLIGSESLVGGFVASSLFYLLQLSNMTLQKSIINVDWVDQFVLHAARPVIDYLQPRHEEFEGRLDPCISNRRLRESYQIIYHVYWLWYSQNQPSQSITHKMLAGYCLIQHNVSQIRLVNHFVYFREELDDAQNMSSSRVSYLISQALLALSLLTYLATFGANPRIGKRYVWDKHLLFLSQLRWLLAYRWRGGLVLAEEEFQVYRNVLLWVYWAGATWEYKESLSPRYFSSRFRNTCRNMNLRSWSQVEAILDRFAMITLAMPPPENWVDIELELAWANHDGDEEGCSVDSHNLMHSNIPRHQH
jgi:hypothetical protein